MDLFRQRPLFLWCVGFLCASAGGFFLFERLLLPSGIHPLSCLLLLVAITVGLGGILLGILLRRGHRRRIITAAVTLLVILAAFVQSYATFAGEQAQYLQTCEHTTVTVTATVSERRGDGGQLTSFALELHTVNDRPVTGLASLTCLYPADLAPGDTVSLSAELVPLDEAVADGYDAAILTGDGYVAGLMSEDESLSELVHSENDTPSWRITAGALRRRLSATLNRLVGDNAGGLPSALLLGDRTALGLTVRRDFARAGISHLLAVSGLHMTLLFGMAEGLLRLLRCPKRIRALLLGLSALGYLVLLGFPPSASRAVIMLGAVYLSTFLSVRADPLTSLGVAGALILAVTPLAVADTGFWMSFLATLGLVVLIPPLHAWVDRRFADRIKTPWQRRGVAWLIKLPLSLLVGVIAVTFTLFLTAAVMGEMGILSAPATMLLTPFCCILLVLSPLALLFSGTALGTVLGRLAALVSEDMLTLTETMAKPSWTVVSLTHPAILPIALGMTAALLVLLAIRLPRKRQWTVILPMLLGWLTVYGVLSMDALLSRGEVDGTYLQPSTQSDMLVLTEGRDTVICDLSNGSLTALRTASTEASRRGATEIRVLLLTHYHSRTSGALWEFLQAETVRALWLPTPRDSRDAYLLLAYWERAQMADVPIVLYDLGDPLTIFGTSEITLQATTIDRSVQPVLFLSVDTAPGTDGVGETVYCGSAIFESDLAAVATERIATADTVIFGNHGPLPKQSFGAELSFGDDARIILSGEGDVAAYLDPVALPPGSEWWLGQKRFSCSP